MPVSSSTLNRVEKVVAYLVREDRMLAFVHDGETEPGIGSGVQVPAGRVETDEWPEEAVLRETAEETGLSGLRLVRYLGSDEVDRRPGRA